MPMPKQEIFFTPNFDDDDAASSGVDSEIEVIPYVKPPPVIIDLLEESEKEDDESPKKKKKSKKKKSKKDKEHRRRRDRDESETSESLNLAEEQNGCESDGGSRVSLSHDVEPPASSPVVVEQSGLGSDNEATGNTTTTAENPSSPPQRSNSVVGKDNPTSSGRNLRNDNGENAVNASIGQEAAANMVGTPSPLAHSRNFEAQPRDSASRKGKGTRKRTISQRQATQRTNEEISQFLTTLGITVEAASFDTPVTRVRRPRRRPSPLPGEESESDRSSISGSGSTAATGTPAVGFVSVTQETGSTPTSSKRSANGSPKGKRRRQAIDGDLSDFQVRITNQELNEIRTNIQSNIVLEESTGNNSASIGRKPPVLTSSTVLDEVIDAVARGLADSTSDTSSKDDEAMDVNDSTTEDTLSGESEQPEVTGNKTPPVTPQVSNPSRNAEGDDNEVAGRNTKTNRDVSKPQLEVISQADSDDEIQCVLNVTTGVTDVRQKSKSSALPNDPEVTESPKQKNMNKPKKNKGRSEPAIATVDTVSTDESDGVVNEENSPSKASTENTEVASSSKTNTPKRSTPRRPDRPAVLKEKDKSKESATLEDNNAKQKQHPTPVELQKGAEPQFSPEETLALSTCSPLTWTTSMVLFYDTERNVDFQLKQVYPSQSDAAEMWIAPEDRMRPPKNKRMYVRCIRCKQLGHFVKECTESFKPPCCHMCGRTGHTSDHHSRQSCPDSQCLNCSKTLSQYSQKCSNCLLKRNPSRCSMCNVLGHGKDVCPDNWRRYHSITSPDEYEKVKSLLDTRQGFDNRGKDKNLHTRRTSRMSCCNCGRRGHSFYECTGTRYNPYHRNKPFVVNDLPGVSTDIIEAGDGRKSAVTTIFDKKTGRTVVVNKDGMARTEIEVETIQVQIRNDLAETSKQDNQDNLDLTKCRVFASCTNKLKPGEKCYQIVVQDRAHVKLTKVMAEGRLKAIEEKRQVQISIIPETAKIHIFGLETIQAEADMYRLLWEKSKPNQQSTDSSPDQPWPVESLEKSSASGGEDKDEPQVCRGSNDNEDTSVPATASSTDDTKDPTAVSSIEPPCITIEDDEDDLCVIEEIPLDRTKIKIAPTGNNQKSSNNKENPNLNDQQQQRRPSENPGPSSTPSSSSNFKGNNSQRMSEHHQGPTPAKRSGLLGDYQSPLAGLSLGERQQQFNPMLEPPQLPPFGFDPRFQQVPLNPNANPFYFPPCPPPNPNPFNQFQLDPNANTFISRYPPPPTNPNVNPAYNPFQTDSPPHIGFNPFDVPPPQPWQNPNPRGRGPRPVWEGANNRNPNPFDMHVQSTTFIQRDIRMTRFPMPMRSPPIPTLPPPPVPPPPPPSDSQQRRDHESEKKAKRRREELDNDADFNLLDDIEVIDHSNDSEGPSAQTEENASETANDDIEIITVEEGEDDEDMHSVSAESSFSSQSQGPRAKVTLLESEFNLVVGELMKQNNELNQISDYFGVDLEASKEDTNFLVYISKGSNKKRAFAKDNVVSWLENKSSNTSFHLLPRGNEVILAQNLANKQSKKKQKRSTMIAARALLLKDADTLSKRRAGKKRRNEWRKQRQEQRQVTNQQGQSQQQPGPSFQNQNQAPNLNVAADKSDRTWAWFVSDTLRKGPTNSGGGGGGGNPRKRNRYFNNNLQ